MGVSRRRGRGWRLVVRALLTLAVLAVLLGTALLVRLSRGPISLDFLTPWVVEALQPPDGSFRVAVGATELVWTERWHDVDLTVREVVISDRDGTTVASFPSLAMEMSVGALLHGELAPSEIELVSPELRLVREPDGAIGFGLGGEGSGGDGTSLLRGLMGDEDGAAPAAEWLRTILIRDGRLGLTDRASGFTTSAVGVEVDVQRKRVGLELTLAAELALGAERIPVRLHVAQESAPAPTRLQLSFRDVQPAALVQATSALVPETGSLAEAVATTAAGLAVPLEGTLGLTVTGTHVDRIEVDVTGGTGHVALPAPWSRNAAIERLAIGGSFDVASATATLRQLEVDLGVPVLRVAGDWTDAPGGGALTVIADVIHVPVDALADWWPADAAADARAWITGNITGGKVPAARVELHAELALGDQPSFTLRSLDGRLSYDGLAVRYVDTMPEALAVTGTATFSPDAWSFRVSGASVAGVAVPGATVEISAITSGSPRIAIDAQARGSLADALALVDHEPLGYARAIGIASRDASGSLTGRLQLAFPLSGAPMPPDLGAVVDARLRGVALPRAVGDWPLRDGDLQLAVAKEVLTVSGTGALTGVPCRVEWKELLGRTTGVTRTVEVASDVDAEGRAALGFDLRPWLNGPTEVKAHVEQAHDGKGTAQVRVDLQRAVLRAPELRIEKPAGTPGEASGTLVLDGASIAAVREFSFSAADATATGTATLGDGRVASVQLHGELPPASSGGERPDFVLTLDPTPTGNRFRLTSEDASTLLRVLLPDSRTSGGDLLFTGNLERVVHGWKLDGDLAVRSFTLTDSPVLARLLTLASLPGILSAMRNTGIAFDSLTSGIAYETGAVTFRDGVVNGPSLRLLMDGTIDGPKDSVAMNGTLVPPIYGLNALPGKIPVIGGLFRGQDGEGLIAIDFTVRGTVKDPSVSVKPLDSLAPGVLRKFVRKVPGW
jgi:hypothetical protein